MNFHPTTASRIREISSTCTVEHRATLHYSYTDCVVVMVVVKNVEEVIR